MREAWRFLRGVWHLAASELLFHRFARTGSGAAFDKARWHEDRALILMRLKDDPNGGG